MCCFSPYVVVYTVWIYFRLHPVSVSVVLARLRRSFAFFRKRFCGLVLRHCCYLILLREGRERLERTAHWPMQSSFLYLLITAPQHSVVPCSRSLKTWHLYSGLLQLFSLYSLICLSLDSKLRKFCGLLMAAILISVLLNI